MVPKVYMNTVRMERLQGALCILIVVVFVAACICFSLRTFIRWNGTYAMVYPIS